MINSPKFCGWYLVTRLLSFLASAAVISGLLFRAVTPASACSCAQTSLEELVASADVIVIGTAVRFFIEPPLDPAIQDSLEHRVYVSVTTNEYLKGAGPAEISLSTDKSYLFNPDGALVTGVGTCGILGEQSIGRSYALFLRGALDNAADPGICSGSHPLTVDPGPGDALQRVRAILQATPTPSPSPAHTAAPTSSPPVGLPRSGGTRDSDSARGLVIASAAAIAMALGGAVAARRYL